MFYFFSSLFFWHLKPVLACYGLFLWQSSWRIECIREDTVRASIDDSSKWVTQYSLTRQQELLWLILLILLTYPHCWPITWAFPSKRTRWQHERLLVALFTCQRGLPVSDYCIVYVELLAVADWKCIYLEMFFFSDWTQNQSSSSRRLLTRSRLLYPLIFCFPFSFALRCQPKVSVRFWVDWIYSFFKFQLDLLCFSSFRATASVCFPSGVCLRLLLLVNGWIPERQVCRSVSLWSVVQSRFTILTHPHWVTPPPSW